MKKLSIVIAIYYLLLICSQSVQPLTIDLLRSTLNGKGAVELAGGVRLISGKEQQAKPVNTSRSEIVRVEPDGSIIELELYDIPAVCDQLAPYLSKYGIKGELAQHFLKVSFEESGCVNGAINSKSHDYGVFQHNKDPKATWDIDYSVREAIRKYRAGRFGVNNFSDWYAVCYPPDGDVRHTPPVAVNGFKGDCH